MRLSHLFTAVLIVIAAGAGLTNAATPTQTPRDGYPAFAIGGDLSWTDRIVDGNIYTYYNTSSLQSGTTDIPSMVYDYGLDAVRLRVWVDPTGPTVVNGFSAKVGSSTVNVEGTYGYCGPADVARMAADFASRGHRIMVCFHLSDTWADPARQFIPAEWADCTDNADLQARVAQHVSSVLTTLREANVNVEWVQIGNETNTGMLRCQLPAASGDAVETPEWGCTISSSDAASTLNFVNTFAAGAEAARAVYPDCKIVLHLANAHYWNSVKWTLSLINRQGFSPSMCDYIGLSLYPANEGTDYDYTDRWLTDTDNAIDCIRQIYDTYGYRSLLVEIGMNNEWSESTTATTQQQNIAQCNTDVEAFTRYLFAHLRDTPSTCDGIFYWSPETDYLDNYKRGACHDIQNSWKRKNITANPFWSVCKENSTFPAGGLVPFDFSGIDGVTADPATDADEVPVYYNLQGLRVARTVPGAVYIERCGSRARKVLAK